ncbi:hypothetical protein BAE44_0012672 [Dichanthelium oligosanthes]|uniref:Uncharacterized protein n=1 Tax=Dichanthelium oligosanthes TaxID=888268 RepID=A0A1E5VME8_9POAL|nr:hypothetical protein BAE44_0012672 [Dichanthelium oligosanthes]
MTYCINHRSLKPNIAMT